MGVLLWGLSLVLAGPTSGEDWQLLDQSESMPAYPQEHPHGFQNEIPRERCFVFHSALMPCGEDWQASPGSNLGYALEELRSRMKSGDLLKLVTDGRFTDHLPIARSMDGVQIHWVRVNSSPGFWLHRPPLVPENGRLILRASLPGANLDKGKLFLSTEPSFQVDPLGVMGRADGDIDIPVVVNELPDGGGVLRLSWLEGNQERTAETKLFPSGTLRVHSNWKLTEDWVQWAHSTVADIHCYRPPFPSAEVIQNLLRTGLVVLLISNESDDWTKLKLQGLELFGHHPPKEPWLFLLDISGSMAHDALRGAQEALLSFVELFPETARPQLWTFSESLGGPFQVVKGSQFMFEPHGPSQLAHAIRGVLNSGAQGEKIILLSDGYATDEPQDSWESLGDQLRQRFGTVECIPLGSEPNFGLYQALAGSGHPPNGSNIKERIHALSRNAIGPAFPVQGIAVSLPAELGLNATRISLSGSPLAEVWMEDSQGSAVLSHRNFSGGQLLGLAADPDDSWLPLLEVFRASNTLEDLELLANYLETTSPAMGWAVQLENGSILPFERMDSVSWRAGPIPDGQAVQLKSPQGQLTWHLPPTRTEWDSPHEFSQWMASLRNSSSRRFPFGVFFIGFLCVIFSAWLQYRRGAGMV